MAIILPQEGSIWQTLGTGLGSGLQALAKGKIKQLENRNYAGALKEMGFDPEIAYLSEKLQPLAIQQQYKGLEALQRQQEAAQGYSALLNQAKQLGLSKSFIKTVEDAGPIVGSQMLKGIIRDLQKPDKAQTFLQTLGLVEPSGRSVYKGVQNPVFNALSDKYGTPNAQALEQGSDSEASYLSLLNNPLLSNEEKQALRQEVAQGQTPGFSSYGPLETTAGVLGNVLSGAAQGVGTLGGLPRLLENLLSPVAEKITKPLVDAEINLWSRKAQEAPEGSPEREAALQHVRALKQDQENAELKAPVTQSFADIKESVVNPIAKMFGVEKYTVPRNFVENIAERVGRVAPATMLSAIGRGTELGLNVLKTLKVPVGAESLGEFTKKITGSNAADGAMTLLGYLFGAYAPGNWNNAIKKGYTSFKQAVDQVPKARIDATPVLEEIQPVVDKISTLPGTQGNKFLKNQIDAVNKAINYASPGAAAKANIPAVSITPHKAFELDQLLGGDTYGTAEKIGKETAQGVQTIREGLRKIWEPYFGQSVPNATKDLLAARDAANMLHFTDGIQDMLTSFSNAKVPLFYVPGHILKLAGKLAKPTRKFFIQMAKSPVLRNATLEALQAAALKDAPGIVNALNKVPKNYR